MFQPNLYDAEITLFLWSTDVVDTYKHAWHPHGARDREWLLLNGRPVYLQGFGRHEDFRS